MRYNIFVFILIILLVVSCGRKKSEITYSHELDTLYINENIFEIYTMLNGVKDGVMTKYERGKKVEEVFYLDNYALVGEKIEYDKDAIGHSFFYNLNDTLRPIGFLWFDINTNEKIQDLCSYPEIVAKDTIDNGQALKVKLKGNLGDFDGFKIKLILGRLTKNYETVRIDTIYGSYASELEFEFMDYQEGINFLTGLIYYYEGEKDITSDVMFYRSYDTGIHKKVPYVFYKQFYVKPPDREGCNPSR